MACVWQDILKQTERAGEDTKTLERALEVMIKTPKEANDMMNVSRLQGFEVCVSLSLAGHSGRMT